MWEVGQLLHEKGDGAFNVKYQLRMFLRTRIFTGCRTVRLFATRASQLIFLCFLGYWYKDKSLQMHF
jgi:hypothetical protein